MRRRILSDLAKTPDDFTDLDDIQKATDDYWFISTCIERLHRLPCELEDIPMSQICTLRAYGIVKSAYEAEVHRHMNLTRPTS